MTKADEKAMVDREILLCVTGGIACYKSASLVSRFVQAGAGVSVAMTAAAQEFVRPLTFQSLSGRHVHTSMWDVAERTDPQHIALTDRADLLIIAPAKKECPFASLVACRRTRSLRGWWKMLRCKASDVPRNEAYLDSTPQ